MVMLTGEVQPVKNISDGTDDEQLQRAMQMAGAVRYRVVDGTTPHAPMPPEGGREVIGVVTRKGHYRLEIERNALIRRFDKLTKAEPGTAMARGWSNGTDNRVRITGAIVVPVEQGQVTTSFWQMQRFAHRASNRQDSRALCDSTQRFGWHSDRLRNLRCAPRRGRRARD